ncbi:hypothetical protein P8452_74615 [Trifolium repens]|nr:hypothetical protein P8452_74615 [Trifolium repens]
MSSNSINFCKVISFINHKFHDIVVGLKFKANGSKCYQIVIVKMKLMMVLLTWKIEGCLMILRMFPKMKSSSCISGTHL